jgi:hypothetical protein
VYTEAQTHTGVSGDGALGVTLHLREWRIRRNEELHGACCSFDIIGVIK